jgi:hypothetical protein
MENVCEDLDNVVASIKGTAIRNYTRETYDNEAEAADGAAVLVVSIEAVMSSNLCFAADQPCTGHAVWFAADNLSNFCRDRYHSFASLTSRRGTQPLRVLELGAGPGLVGITLAKLFEGKDKSRDLASFLLTDGDEEVVKLLRRNCIRNFLSESNDFGIESESSNVSVGCQRFFWGKSQAEKLLQNEKGFDVILGSDLIYGRRGNYPGDNGSFIADLFDTAELLLLNDDSLFFLAFTRRDLPIEIVLETANSRGLVWELQEDYVYDIFDTNTDGLTCFWRDAIYSFTRGDGVAQLKLQQDSAKCLET